MLKIRTIGESISDEYPMNESLVKMGTILTKMSRSKKMSFEIVGMKSPVTWNKQFLLPDSCRVRISENWKEGSKWVLESIVYLDFLGWDIGGNVSYMLILMSDGETWVLDSEDEKEAKDVFISCLNTFESLLKKREFSGQSLSFFSMREIEAIAKREGLEKERLGAFKKSLRYNEVGSSASLKRQTVDKNYAEGLRIREAMDERELRIPSFKNVISKVLYTSPSGYSVKTSAFTKKLSILDPKGREIAYIELVTPPRDDDKYGIRLQALNGKIDVYFGKFTSPGNFVGYLPEKEAIKLVDDIVRFWFYHTPLDLTLARQAFGAAMRKSVHEVVRKFDSVNFLVFDSITDGIK